MNLKLFLAVNLISGLFHSPIWALPPAEDMPEEVLRTEIILEGRSPIDGKPMSAREYEQLKAQLAQRAIKPEVDSNIRQLIFLLQIRKFFKDIIPFV